MKNKASFSEKMRMIMVRAWGLYRRGVVSMSICLKLSWSVAKGERSEKNLVKNLFKANPVVKAQILQNQIVF